MHSTRQIHRRGPVRVEPDNARVSLRVRAAWEVSAASIPASIATLLALPGTEDLVLEIGAEIEHPGARSGRSGTANTSACSWSGEARLVHPRTGASVEVAPPTGGEGVLCLADGFVHADLPGLLRLSVGADEDVRRPVWATTPVLGQLGIRAGCSQLLEAGTTE